MFPFFLYCTSGHYQKVPYNSCLFLFFRHEIQKREEHILHIVLYSKNNFSIMNKIKLFIHYTEIIFFWVKMYLFMYFKNISYHVTLENVFRILDNSVYFQSIVVCKEPLKLRTIVPVICPVFRKGSANSFSDKFCVWFFQKFFFHVLFYKLAKIHCLIVFTYFTFKLGRHKS